MRGHLSRNRGCKVWTAIYYGPRPDGSTGRIKESTKTEDRKTAEKFLSDRLADIRNDALGIAQFAGPASKKLTVDELLDDLIADYEIRQIKGEKKALDRIRRGTAELSEPALRTAFGRRRASTIRTATIVAYVKGRRAEGRQNATINRELELLRRAFSLAVENKKVAEAFVPSFPEKLVENVRTGTVSAEDFARLVKALGDYAPLDDVFRFGYLTGWRRGQILSLEWKDVDLKARSVTVPGVKTKAGKPHSIPLDEELFSILIRQRGRDLGSKLVFHRNGKRISKGVFQKQTLRVRRDLGLAEVLFHDFRRTFATEARRAGVPEGVIMAIGGWRTRSVFERYAITNEADMRKAFESRREFLAITGPRE